MSGDQPTPGNWTRADLGPYLDDLDRIARELADIYAMNYDDARRMVEGALMGRGEVSS